MDTGVIFSILTFSTKKKHKKSLGFWHVVLLASWAFGELGVNKHRDGGNCI